MYHLFYFPLLCRFKNHLFDLTFMEKVTRWLTNTQVKVKSEVSVGKEIVKLFPTLHSRPQRPRSFWSAPKIKTFGRIRYFEHPQRAGVVF